MNKTIQSALLVAAGIAAGVGGTKLSEGAQPAPEVRVHALDLRRGAELPDGGFSVTEVAYGTLLRLDGGTKDIGQAKRCKPSRALNAMLELAAQDCEWEP